MNSARLAIVEFWTAPVRGSSAALFRVSYGALSIWTAIGVLLNLERYYTDAGMLPWTAVQHAPEQLYSLFSLAPHSTALVWAVGLAFLLASVSLTVGFWSRSSALLIFVANVALQHRNPYALNSGDRLFLVLALLGALLPLGMRFSVDAWRAKTHGEKPARSAGSIWGQRLIALQIAYVYWYSFAAKLKFEAWQQGTALRDVLASPVFSEWPTQVDSSALIAVLTWSTLAFELMFPILIWETRLRPYVLAAGALLHLGIEITLTIPIFSAIMLVSYSCFLSDDETERLVGIGRRSRLRLGRSRSL